MRYVPGPWPLSNTKSFCEYFLQHICCFTNFVIWGSEIRQAQLSLSQNTHYYESVLAGQTVDCDGEFQVAQFVISVQFMTWYILLIEGDDTISKQTEYLFQNLNSVKHHSPECCLITLSLFPCSPPCPSPGRTCPVSPPSHRTCPRSLCTSK